MSKLPTSDEDWFRENQTKVLTVLGGSLPRAEQSLASTKNEPHAQPSKPTEPIVSVLSVGGLPVLDKEWPNPDEIFDSLLPVEGLKLELIPEPFREWISDTASRMPCPIDFVAAAAVVITSSVIGAGCGIRPKANDDWLELPNLWGAIIGVPGKLKSPAIKKPLALLSKLEATAKTKYEQEKKEYEFNVSVR